MFINIVNELLLSRRGIAVNVTVYMHALAHVKKIRSRMQTVTVKMSRKTVREEPLYLKRPFMSVDANYGKNNGP